MRPSPRLPRSRATSCGYAITWVRSQGVACPGRCGGRIFHGALLMTARPPPHSQWVPLRGGHRAWSARPGERFQHLCRHARESGPRLRQPSNGQRGQVARCRWIHEGDALLRLPVDSAESTTRPRACRGCGSQGYGECEGDSLRAGKFITIERTSACSFNSHKLHSGAIAPPFWLSSDL